MNTEKCMAPNSIIIMHDCIPTDVYMARRRQHDEEIRRQTSTPASWTGDVWKTILALRKYRKDLKIYPFDADPTGLVFITNLDPNSSVLRNNYDAITRELGGLQLSDYGLRHYHAELGIYETSALDSPEKMIGFLS
jgi:hypothetical protein